MVARLRGDAEALGEAHEVRVDEVGRDGAAAVSLFLDQAHVAVHAVVEHHHHDGDAVLGGGREIAELVHDAAVAGDGEHGLVGHAPAWRRARRRGPSRGLSWWPAERNVRGW